MTSVKSIVNNKLTLDIAVAKKYKPPLGSHDFVIEEGKPLKITWLYG
jgi:hypothetical protein